MNTKLITKEMLDKFPRISETGDKKPEDVKIIAKFFHPFSHWTWYATEFDGKDLFFGFVRGDFPELGYFTLSELQSVNINGIPIERDRFFGFDHTLKEVMDNDR